MPQKPSDRRLLREAIKQWERAAPAPNPSERIDPSTRGTVAFLWLAAGVLFVGLTWTIFDTFGRAEKHRHDSARPALHAPGAQDRELQVDPVGDGGERRHAEQVEPAGAVRP